MRLHYAGARRGRPHDPCLADAEYFNGSKESSELRKTDLGLAQIRFLWFLSIYPKGCHQRQDQSAQQI